MATYDETVKAILALRGTEDPPIKTLPVPAGEVEAAEALVGRPFPDDLKAVWRDIGGGFFSQSLSGGDRLDEVNCLMGPLDVADVMRHRRWTGAEARPVPFYNEADEDFILVVPTDTGYAIEHEHARGAALAPDVREFVRRLAEDPAFWVELLPDP